MPCLALIHTQNSSASARAAPEGGQESSFTFDDGENYCPLFCFAESPDKVCHCLSLNYFSLCEGLTNLLAQNSKLDPNSTPWLAISSTPSLPQLPSRNQISSCEPPSKSTPTPFLNSIIPQINSFKAHSVNPQVAMVTIPSPTLLSMS